MDYLLGDIKCLEVKITECREFKNTIDKMLKKTNLALLLGTSSWREQFKEAITVSTGDEEDEDAQPSYGDYVMHYITLFWKILFAFVPPTDMNGGWACFTVAISMIGILTAVTGDVASHFGCTVGLADSVVAISFVALGTSLPGEPKVSSVTCHSSFCVKMFVLNLCTNISGQFCVI